MAARIRRCVLTAGDARESGVYYAERPKPAFSKARRPRNVSRDPEDDKFLPAAVEGGARFLLTGDRDLLDLESHSGVLKVPTPWPSAGSRSLGGEAELFTFAWVASVLRRPC